MANPSDIALLNSIGFDEKKATETAKNIALTATIKALLEEAGIAGGCEKSVGAVIYNLATKYPSNALRHRHLIAKRTAEKKITSVNVDSVLTYVKKVGDADLDVAHFENECGVGVVVPPEVIREAVAHLLTEKRAELLEKRYHLPVGPLAGLLRKDARLKWAEGAALTAELEAQIAAILGPRTPDDDKPLAKAKPEKKPEEKKAPAAADGSSSSSSAGGDKKPVDEFAAFAGVVAAQETIRFPAPEENVQNTPELLANHLRATGGKVVTRFPPEPNGYLHIGHAKAMHLDFGYAKKHGGITYMRFDDTNPEKESQEYIDSILDTLKWMGHEPCAITYSSQYFPQLYELAVELIKRGLAYIDFDPVDVIKLKRKAGIASPDRDRPVAENLKLFEDMRKGKFAEGAAVLRMKGDMNSPNYNMRDLVAYRIKYHPHPVSGDAWCIYPSYDYTHCLVDSIENITHSLCTLEFETRRESYNWLIDVLGLYRPVVWEFARLNLTHTLLSKRRLIKLVNDKIVRGWDDPRMSTINGFRRRGYTAESINLLCEKIGVTRHNTTIPIEFLELCARIDLDPKAPRAMVVLHPLKVTITNLEPDFCETIAAANFPSDSSRGTHPVPFSRTVWIDRSDFKLEDVPGFYGLAPGKEVLLKYAYNVRCTDVVRDANGDVVELLATVDKANSNKVKGVLQWVSVRPGEAPIGAEVRLYEHLFKSDNPAELDDWLGDINPNSLTIIENAYIDESLKSAKVFDKFQFERLGYFCVDPDSTPAKLVFNRTVTLKESKEKSKLLGKDAPAAAAAAAPRGGDKKGKAH